MKKKIIILISVICISAVCAYGIFCIRSKKAWNELIISYIEEKNKSFIYKNNLIDFISEKDIERLPLVSSGEISKDTVVEDQKKAKEIVKNFVLNLQNTKLSYIRTAKEENLLYGLICEKGFLYVYENGYTIVNNDGSYYAYIIKDIDSLNSLYEESAFDFNGNPYYRMK